MIPRTAIPIGSKEIITFIEKIFASGEAGAEDIERFEDDLAKYLGVRRIFSFSRGRTALTVALQALGLRPGDEVIVPAYTCAIVFEVVLRLGLRPVLVDVDPATCNINPSMIAKAVTPRAKVIMPVHLFGRPCDMDSIVDVAGKNDLYVVEDAAQALGAEYKGAKVGTLGDLAMFSFGPGKSITGGEGGAISINNRELIDDVQQLWSRLSTPRRDWLLHMLKNVIAMYVFSDPHLYWIVARRVERQIEETDDMILQNCLDLMEGKTDALNPTVETMKMHNASAALLCKQLEKIEEINERRISNALELTELLSDIGTQRLQPPPISDETKNTFTTYAVRVEAGKRGEVVKELIKKGVDTAKPYEYLTKFLSKYPYGKYPRAEELCRSLVAIPNHPLVTSDDVRRIFSIVKSVFA